MARMRAVKQQLKDLLSAPDWRDHLPELRSMGQPAVGPLFSFLLLEPLMRHKAALALGADALHLPMPALRGLEEQLELLRRIVELAGRPRSGGLHPVYRVTAEDLLAKRQL